MARRRGVRRARWSAAQPVGGYARHQHAHQRDDAVEVADARRLGGEERLLAVVVDDDVPVGTAVGRAFNDVAAEDGAREHNGLRRPESARGDRKTGAVGSRNIEVLEQCSAYGGSYRLAVFVSSSATSNLTISVNVASCAGVYHELQRLELLGLQSANERAQADQRRRGIFSGRSARPARKLVHGGRRELEEGPLDLAHRLRLLVGRLVLELPPVVVADELLGGDHRVAVPLLEVRDPLVPSRGAFASASRRCSRRRGRAYAR